MRHGLVTICDGTETLLKDATETSPTRKKDGLVGRTGLKLLHAKIPVKCLAVALVRPTKSCGQKRTVTLKVSN